MTQTEQQWGGGAEFFPRTLSCYSLSRGHLHKHDTGGTYGGVVVFAAVAQALDHASGGLAHCARVRVGRARLAQELTLGKALHRG
jgi:hypothetical protein